MHSPLPGIVAGRNYDVDYNYKLSDMDKAYIALMYPRIWPHERAPEWTLEAALARIGLTQETPALAEKIQELARVSKANGSIDPTRIRDLVFGWVTWFHATQQPGHTTSAAETPSAQNPIPRHDASDITYPRRRTARMEFSDKLMKGRFVITTEIKSDADSFGFIDYLDAQKDWERQKDEMVGGSLDNQGSGRLDDLKKRLWRIGESEKARLASKYPGI
ncbi:hypothetical protein QQX98_000909 [Neonectria punicea]|uniref:Uncharacterized protein n=1 Tax=Neonectria punicea TaxID=979145 RepID=A0ABR1HRX1_9HYPO